MKTFLSLSSLLAVAAFTGGCAEPAFSPHIRDNDVVDIAHALQVAGADTGAKRSPTAYLVTAGDKHLVSYDLDGGRVNWDVAADVTSRVAVGRGFVAHRVGREAAGKEPARAQSIVVRSAGSGAQRCAINLKSDEQFLGLTADARIYYVVQTLTGATRVSALVAASSDTCAELWRDEAAMSIGSPAARGDVVAVPYAYQNIVFLDARTGQELARVRATDESVSFVRATAEGFFYGDNKGVYRFDDKSAGGSKKATSYAEAHLSSSQIRTFFYWDAYQPSQSDYTAFDRNRLLWRADGEGDRARFRDDAAYLHNFRYIFSFNAKSSDLRWVYSHPRVDLVGSDDTGPSLVFASADGELGALDTKTGALMWSKKTDLKVVGATFDADGFAPAGAKAEAAPLMKTLGDIIADHDARFTAVKVFAVSSLTRLPGPDATATLVQVVTTDGIAPPVAKAAAEALLARADASSKQLYRDALKVRTDYLNDRHPRGVDVLARVEAAIGDTESVPLLAAQLLDPSTPLPALREIVKALVTLGGSDAVAALRDLLLIYRADASFNADPLSLQLAAEGLLKLGGSEGRRIVVFVAEEPRTMPSLTAHIHRVLGAAAEKPAATAAQLEAVPAALVPGTRMGRR